jgi:hypothetical protein
MVHLYGISVGHSADAVKAATQMMAPAPDSNTAVGRLREKEAMVKQQRRLYITQVQGYGKAAAAAVCLPACSEDRIWTDHSDSDGSLL